MASPLAASQRPYRSAKLSRAQRKLNGASHRFGLIRYMQIFASYLQCSGEQYSASATRQSRVIYFSTDDMASTRDWKAVPAALDLNSTFGFFSQARLTTDEQIRWQTDPQGLDLCTEWYPELATH